VSAPGVKAQPLAGDPVSAARRLLGAVLRCRGVSARVVEVEAYGGPEQSRWPDPASHAYRGLTPRNAVMFGPAGRLYVYRSYGIHLCANVSCGPDGTPAAVLVRAAVIESGLQAARNRRGPAVADSSLARGPGNLCSALGITLPDNGCDLFDPQSAVTVELAEPLPATAGPRVGVSAAADLPWRLWASGRPEVSAYRRSPRAPYGKINP